MKHVNTLLNFVRQRLLYVIAFMLCNKISKKSKGPNMKDIRGIYVASLNPPMCSNDQENALLTEEEIHKYFMFLNHKKILDQELFNLRIKGTEFASIQETVDVLYKHDNIKNVTEMVIGILTIANRITFKSLYKQYDSYLVKH
ncbi:PREDICTED: uncharacterized protein LOC108554438 [Eufriesea mexicana]|uniref:uncharacterized protein LOC108554438 n=1 Tax=Eufriesea mexicana TaxID=516756 RepID=UPI00083C2E33|nr:PREDICTED: uncharacterized protein LOC108554438 [Eufriesea mexicana]